MTEQQVQSFRQRYRAEISRYYNGYLHMSFVGLSGLLFLWLCAQRLAEPSPLDWLVLALSLVLWNFIEYGVHVHLGHQKTRHGRLFYARHTGDHHTFFSEQMITPRDHRDWRVVLFPAWLIVLSSALASAAGFLLSLWLGTNAGLMLAIGLVSGYLLYEFFHFCDHLENEHPLVALPWIREMRQLHRLHHRRELMATHNFNLTAPLADWLLGTYYWEPQKTKKPQ